MIAKLSKTQKNATHQGTKHQDHDHKQLINLFPLHPENQQDKLDEDHNMASIFSSCEDATLTGILCSNENDEQENEKNHSHSSVNYADEEVKLVRTAMRRTKTVENDNDDDDEGKWVCYSEVVERSSSSSTSSYYHCDNNHNNKSNGYYDHDKRRKLILKLDYEKLMKLWVNKGPLFLHGDLDQPQTVPDLQVDDFFWPSSNNVTRHDEQNNGGSTGLWTVPETNHYREASVQRYKDKRRNRLFHKTVRYEVRKLNAQKRPRIRGRFVEST